MSVKGTWTDGIAVYHPQSFVNLTPVAPGLRSSDEMSDVEYHAHPSLSCSQARRLLACPAKYHHDLTAEERHADYFDLGSAAHKLVLGAGRPLRVIDHSDWRTKDAKEQRAEAYADGEIPVLIATYRQVCDMADAVLDHPIAAAVLQSGRPEVSAFWTDETGVPLRCRFDWLREVGRPIVVDLKTTTNASPSAFARSVASFGYHVQAAWYQYGAVAVLGLDEPPPFVFIAQETEPPYLVGVYELDDEALEVGRRQMRRAIDLYWRCVEADDWPGYRSAVLSLPRWATFQTDTEET